MVDNQVPDSSSSNREMGEPSPSQLSPQEERRRQIFLLIGLAVLFAVILAYQVYRLKQISKEAAQKPAAPQTFALRTGPDTGVWVRNPRPLAKGVPVLAFEEISNPEKLHLAWVDPWAPPRDQLVSLDFVATEDLAKVTPSMSILSSLNGCVEWEVGSVKKRGVPDGMGGYYDVTEADVDPKQFFMMIDTLPPLSQPAFVSPQEASAERIMGLESAGGIVSATYQAALEDTDRVLGVSFAGIAKAYPIKILNYHPLVNDTYGNQPVVVTYSPFAGAGMAYRHNVVDATDPFSRTNLLYNGCEIISDTKTRSLWTTLDGHCGTGPRHGENLEPIAAIQTTWKDWYDGHPDTLVLSSQTGYGARQDSQDGILYGFDQLRGIQTGQSYYELEQTVVPITLPDGSTNRAGVAIDPRIRNKSWVIGVRTPKPVAFDVEKLAEAGPSPFDVVTAERTLRICFDKESLTAYATGASGDTPLPDATLCLWYVWRTTYPETELHQ